MKLQYLRYRIRYKIYFIIYRRLLSKELKAIQDERQYCVFDDVREIAKWAAMPENRCPDPIPFDFSDYSPQNALECYCGYWSEYVNPYLRLKCIPYAYSQSAEDIQIKIAKESIPLIDSVILQRKVCCDILAVRWVVVDHICSCFSIKSLNDLKCGQIYEDKGYISTSLWAPFIGCYDHNPRNITRSALLLLKVPQGTNGIYVEGHISRRKEYELIINRNSKMRIDKIHHVFWRPYIIVCSLIP